MDYIFRRTPRVLECVEIELIKLECLSKNWTNLKALWATIEEIISEEVVNNRWKWENYSNSGVIFCKVVDKYHWWSSKNHEKWSQNRVDQDLDYWGILWIFFLKLSLENCGIDQFVFFNS